MALFLFRTTSTDVGFNQKMIERQRQAEKEQARDTYRQLIYTTCLKIMPVGADITCLLMACLCLALYHHGKASGAHGASPRHHFGP